MPDTELLIEELEARDIVMDGWHEPSVILTPDERDSLIATVKQLRARQDALEQALRPLWAISVPSGTPEPENMEQLISDLKQLPRPSDAALQSQLEQLRAENERLKNRDVVCWHCGSVLLAPSKPRCEDCPTECDVVNCDAYGCTERLVSQHLDSWK